MKFIFIFTTLMLANATLSKPCIFSQKDSKIRCFYAKKNSYKECKVIQPADLNLGTPIGKYKIGTYYYNTVSKKYWFNLYPYKASGQGYWDYYTEVPTMNCRSYIGLHSGTISQGCITVDEKCFPDLVTVINEYYQLSNTIDVSKCISCNAKYKFCLLETNNNVGYTTDLEVIKESLPAPMAIVYKLSYNITDPSIIEASPIVNKTIDFNSKLELTGRRVEIDESYVEVIQENVSYWVDERLVDFENIGKQLNSYQNKLSKWAFTFIVLSMMMI